MMTQISSAVNKLSYTNTKVDIMPIKVTLYNNAINFNIILI